MKRILAIAHNTFRETIRDRVLYSLLFFGLLVITTSLVAGEITIGDADKVVRSVGLGAIRVFGSVFALFLGIGLVYKELERKTIYTIASKPIPRWIFVLGKYAGLMGVIAVQLAAMGLIYTVVVGLQQGLPPLPIYVALGMLYVELGLITAWALLFSTYSSPVTASLFSMGVLIIGNLADDVWLFAQQAESDFVRDLAGALYWVLPNFDVMNVHELAVHHLAIPGGRILLGLGYGVGYTAAVLALAAVIFSGRDFK